MAGSGAEGWSKAHGVVRGLGSDRCSQGGNSLHSVISQDREEWSQGDPEGADMEKEDSDGHVPGADLPPSEELNGTKSLLDSPQSCG